MAHYLPARHTDGSSTRLDIKADSWAEWDRITDEYSRNGFILRRVGWCHSHPGIDIFLSKWDLDVCQEFKRPTQVAMVVDPINKRGGFFVRGKVGFRPDAPQSFWEMHDISSSSLVEWTNVKTIDVRGSMPQPVVPATPVPGKPAAAETAGSESNVPPAEAAAAETATAPLLSKAPEAPIIVEPRPAKELIIKPLLWALLVLGSGSLLLQAWSAWSMRALADRIPQAAAASGKPSEPPGEPAVAAATPAPADTGANPKPAVTPSGVQVTINPTQARLKQSETKKFTAKVSGNTNHNIVWSVSPHDAGTVNAAGVYKAPAAVTAARDVTVTATSKADPAQSASATVSLIASNPTPPTPTPPKPPPPAAQTPPPAQISVTIDPSEATLKASESKQFTPTVKGSNDTTVEWSIDPPNAGSIDQQGNYQAPAAVDAANEVKVVAKSKADPTKSGHATVKLTREIDPMKLTPS